MSPADVFLIAICVALGLGCLRGVLRSRAPLRPRLIWSVIVLIPVLGPLLYATIYRMPETQEESVRAPGSGAVDDG
ncbi:unnamed protein product [Discosporangium mesarthrocarpum]